MVAIVMMLMTVHTLQFMYRAVQTLQLMYEAVQTLQLVPILENLLSADLIELRISHREASPRGLQ